MKRCEAERSFSVFNLAGMNFSRKLLGWYDKNKRDLPWRNTQDPYKVWLSEIILQQTRVDQGMSYYVKFIKLFPTVKKLADADEDAVLKAWQGLGYYGRARNLHATAKHIAYDFKGKFPSKQKELMKLKGVGEYTSAAIASFCFGEKAAVVDGNVIRVLSRIYGVTEAIDSTKGKETIKSLADELIDNKEPGLYNQAIMEFGAIHCTPHSPACESCPFENACYARKEGIVNEIPFKEKKTVVKDIWLYYFFIKYKDKTYLRKRSGKGIWKGLFDFPGILSEMELNHVEVVPAFLKENALGSIPEILHVSEEYIHILSHRKIHARFFSVRIPKRWTNFSEEIRETELSKVGEFAIPRLIDKFLERELMLD